MTNLHTNGLTLDRGIDGVSHHSRDTDDLDLWPHRGSLPPPSQAVKAQLTELLGMPDTTSYLNSYLRPTISNLELLTPSRFHSTLSRILNNLPYAHDTQQQHEKARLLKRTKRLLSEEDGLRDLISMYRHALHQG